MTMTESEVQRRLDKYLKTPSLREKPIFLIGCDLEIPADSISEAAMVLSDKLRELSRYFQDMDNGIDVKDLNVIDNYSGKIWIDVKEEEQPCIH